LYALSAGIHFASAKSAAVASKTPLGYVNFGTIGSEIIENPLGNVVVGPVTGTVTREDFPARKFPDAWDEA
jgi:hypothetical protein